MSKPIFRQSRLLEGNPDNPSPSTQNAFDGTGLEILQAAKNGNAAFNENRQANQQRGPVEMPQHAPRELATPANAIKGALPLRRLTELEQQQVSAAIHRLGSSDHEEREAAQQTLRLFGQAAESSIEQALSNPDHVLTRRLNDSVRQLGSNFRDRYNANNQLYEYGPMILPFIEDAYTRAAQAGDCEDRTILLRNLQRQLPEKPRREFIAAQTRRGLDALGSLQENELANFDKTDPTPEARAEMIAGHTRLRQTYELLVDHIFSGENTTVNILADLALHPSAHERQLLAQALQASFSGDSRTSQLTATVNGTQFIIGHSPFASGTRLLFAPSEPTPIRILNTTEIVPDSKYNGRLRFAPPSTPEEALHDIARVPISDLIPGFVPRTQPRQN